MHHIPTRLRHVIAFSGASVKLRGFPVSTVPLPTSQPLLNGSNASTPHRLQFLLTYAAPTSASSEVRFMQTYVDALQQMGFVLQQHANGGTPGALYSLVDRDWEVLVEGATSTVQVSIVQRH